MNGRRLIVAQLRRHVPGDAEMRVLVDGLGDEYGYVLARFHRRQESRGRLHGSDEYHADVRVELSNPNTAFAVENVTRFATSSDMRYSVLLYSYVGKDVRLLRVEAERYDVQRIIVGKGERVLHGQAVFVQELLVVGHLEIQRRVEGILQVFREHPGHQVAQVSMARRAPSRVQDELFALLIFIEQPFQVRCEKNIFLCRAIGMLPVMRFQRSSSSSSIGSVPNSCISLL